MLFTPMKSSFLSIGEELEADGIKVKIVSYIDNGSSTEVYSAVNLKDQSRLAVKCMCHGEEGVLELICNEFEKLKYLNKFVKISEKFSKNSEICLYLILPLYGRDMYRLVSRPGLFNVPIINGHHTPTGAAGYSIEIFLASAGLVVIREIDKLHSAGVIHGDIHSYNVVTGAGDDLESLHLIDFGSAKFTHDFTGPERIKKRDFKRVGEMIQFLIDYKIELTYGRDAISRLSRLNELHIMIKADHLNIENVLKKYLEDRKFHFMGAPILVRETL